MSTFVISTFIVGRRFCSRHDFNSGSRICLCRDPENNKDVNAIKVLFAESECDNALGYLSKELAQYLSPLIDTFHLKFESPTAAIPIHIECKNVLPCDENHSDKIKLFKSLRRHALHAAELATTGLLGMTRYQPNLVLLIEEILKNYSHILTSSEKSFLESFLSIPDESQRLFARLYTRKGPWFRLSNVSYPEIADCNQALKGLVELGYMVSFPCQKELENDDFKEVLDVLNVDELRKAARMLKMKCHNGLRKHDIIKLLLSSCTDRRLCPKLQSFFLDTTKSCVQISPLAESLLWRTENISSLIRATSCPTKRNYSDTVFGCIEISVSRLSVSSEEAES